MSEFYTFKDFITGNIDSPFTSHSSSDSHLTLLVIFFIFAMFIVKGLPTK